MKILKIIFLLFMLLNVSLSCKRHYSGGQEEYYNHNNIESSRSGNPSLEPKIEQNQSNSTSSVSELFKQLEPSVFVVIAGRNKQEFSFGSAFLIGNNIGITNHHVIEEHGQDIYAFINEKIYPITVLNYSRKDNLDYAIFRLDDFWGSPLKIANKRSEIGEDIFAIGSPKGLKNSLTKGTISGYRENHRIQIDATIDHGSSGGALFNMKGEVIGITSGGYEGKELNFAIDILAIPYDSY